MTIRCNIKADKARYLLAFCSVTSTSLLDCRICKGSII